MVMTIRKVNNIRTLTEEVEVAREKEEIENTPVFKSQRAYCLCTSNIGKATTCYIKETLNTSETCLFLKCSPVRGSDGGKWRQLYLNNNKNE